MQRRDFMQRLFTLLDEERIEYVVLRNFAAVFAESDSDVDILTPDAPRFYAFAERAAAETGHRPVQQTRFANHSRLYWNGADSFTRIDVDTTLRWRCFPAIDEASVLARRIRAEHFYIPSPADELSALRLNIVWNPSSEPKYAARLAELAAIATSPKLDRATILRRCLSPLRWPAVLRNCADDLQRAIGRFRNPPGAVFQLATVLDFDEARFRNHLAALFPGAKGADRSAARKALFKGGLVFEMTRGGNKSPIGNPSRNFIAALRLDGTIEVTHVESGRTITREAASNPEQVAAHALLELLAENELKQAARN